ncbi:hypothetical protein DSUL_60201 [Desulfovibrionales bacterium]
MDDFCLSRVPSIKWRCLKLVTFKKNWRDNINVTIYSDGFEKK